MIAPQPDRDAARIAGERRRDRGLLRASHDHARDIATMQLALLDAVAISPDGRATTDDAAGEHLHRRYADGGKWVGSAVRELATDGLIRADGATRSDRAARHRGLLTVWLAVDRPAIDRRRDSLRRTLADWPTTNETGATTGIVTPANPELPTPKETSNEPTT